MGNSTELTQPLLAAPPEGDLTTPAPPGFRAPPITRAFGEPHAYTVGGPCNVMRQTSGDVQAVAQPANDTFDTALTNRPATMRVRLFFITNSLK